MAMKRSILAVMLAAAFGLSWSPMWAQQQDAPDPGDASEHGVARLSLMQGSVSVTHGDAGEPSAGALNAPLVTTDRVLTGEGARAEVQFDASNMIRLAPGSDVRLSELEYKRYQVQIAQGTTMFRVARDGDAQVEISTPTVLVRPLRRGSYRVTVNPDGVTEVTVREGQAEVLDPRGSEQLGAGRSMLARGTASDPEVQTVATTPADEWDRWNSDRDRVFDRMTSGRYVSPDVSGAESLDPYGSWRNDPQYGNVWVPTVGADWAPYRDGRWAWIDYYGWTWVGDEPWGWAPYHYGGWYQGPWGWAWYPGAIGPRYYWRPALVGFFGWGGGFGVGAGFGFANVGWVPLAPFEAFHPWYGRGFGGYNRFNVVNNVNITNVYRNARFTNAVTSVRSGEFGRGAVGGNNFVRASNADLARAGSVRGAMPFTPSQGSRRFSEAAPASRGMPQTNSNMRFSGAATRGAGVGAAGAGTRGFGGSAQATAPNNGGGFRSSGPASPNTGSNGGWRRVDPSTGAGTRGFAGSPQASAPNNGGGAAQPRTFAGAQPNAAPRSFPASQQSYNAPQQRVQINPPIVHDRGSQGGGNGHPQSHAGNFGGAHSGGGGGGGGNRGLGGGSHDGGGGRR
jgi:hypothetical protein